MINEKLGVPEGLIENSKEFLKYLKERINTIPNKPISIKEGEGITIPILSNFSFEVNNKEITIDPIVIRVTYTNNESDITGYSVSGEFTPKIKGGIVKVYADVSNVPFNINVNISTDDPLEVGFIKELVLDNLKLDYISHELKHIYDQAYDHKSMVSLKSKSEYAMVRKMMGLISKEVNEFIFLLYYFSDIENSVRLSEIYTKMKEEGVTKKDFKEYLKSSDIIENIKKVENFDFNELLDKLEEDDNLRDHMKRDVYSDPNYIRMGSYREDIANIIFISFVNGFGSSVEMILKTAMANEISPFDMIFGSPDMQKMSEKLNKIHDKAMRSMMKYENNPIKYFDKKVKSLKLASNKLKRQIHKLYDMLPESKENSNSIVNWDLHSKINKRDSKLESKFIETEFISFLKNKKDPK